jgi:hypothetical protein
MDRLATIRKVADASYLASDAGGEGKIERRGTQKMAKIRTRIKVREWSSGEGALLQRLKP